MLKRILCCIPLLITVFSSVAQITTVKGKITDTETGDPIPFVNVLFKGTSVGTTTDFEGYYQISTSNAADTLQVSYIGYYPRSKYVKRGVEQILNFQLEPEVRGLDEVVFVAGENPAFPIMRKVIRNKKLNDKRSLEAFEYESYTKIEVDIDRISEELREKKMMKAIEEVMDSLDLIAGEDGKPILPLFISESISEYYVNNNPYLRKEKVLKSKLTGVGVEDGSLVTKFLGSSFQEYNFYKSWMTIIEKEFVSPLADGWKGYYEYYLVDSLWIDDHFCYQMEIYPKRKEDPAFQGTIWITKEEAALKQIDVAITETANLNYVEKIKIQQTLGPTKAGPWLPVKTRVLIDLTELGKNSAGMLFKFYSSSKDWVVNQPHDLKFFTYPIEMEEDHIERSEEYWSVHRHDSLTESEKNVYAMIDTLKNVPRIKTWVDIVDVLITGYYEAGKVDFGSYIRLLAINDVEGTRVRLGFKTNIDFSDKWVIRGYMAYGTRDQTMKYGGSVRYIFNKKPWTEMKIGGSYDVEQVGISREGLEDNPVFFAATRFGDLRRPYMNSEGYLSFQTQLNRGLMQRVRLRYTYFDPVDSQFNFAYRTEPGNPDSPLATDYSVTEIQLTTRFGPDEIFVIHKNDRVSLGNRKWPVFTFNYTYGIKGLFGGDLEYHNASLNIKQTLKLGTFGTSWYSLTGGRNFSTVPYPLLSVHLGNESVFFTNGAYNLMNWFEFVSDSYVSLKYQHKFQGLLLNRVPLMRKLKWRLVTVANVLYGDIRQENIDIIPEVDVEGVPVDGFNSLGRTPYVEIGYGIENVFKILRLDAYHRLTYRDNPNISKFAVKINFQLIL